MNLFTKPILEITFQDIDGFCKQGIKENIRVEYKKELSNTNPNKQIAKEISAFANTQGGILLYGVDEQDRKPVLPLTGMDKTPDLEQRIKATALDNIYPPVFPEVQLCENPTQGDKVFVIIRVHQSDETPHCIDGKTGFYIRADDHSVPRKATIDELEWLQNHRTKAIENRKRILDRVKDRFLFMPWTFDKCKSFQSISIMPFFPSRELVSVDDLYTTATKIRSGDNVRILTFDHPDSAQNSLISTITRSDYVSYNEVNTFGLGFHKSSILYKGTDDYGQEVELLPQEVLLQTIYCALNFAIELYKKISYWGLLDVTYSLEGVLGKLLSYHNGSWGFVGKVKYDQNIKVQRKTTVAELENNLDDFIVDIFKEIRWSCGHQVPEPDSQHYGTIKALLGKAKMSLYGKDRCPCTKQYKPTIAPMCVICELAEKEKDKTKSSISRS